MKHRPDQTAPPPYSLGMSRYKVRVQQHSSERIGAATVSIVGIYGAIEWMANLQYFCTQGFSKADESGRLEEGFRAGNLLSRCYGEYE